MADAIVIGDTGCEGYVRMGYGGMLAILGTKTLAQMVTVHGSALAGEFQYWNGSAYDDITNATAVTDYTLLPGTGDLTGYTVLTMLGGTTPAADPEITDVRHLGTTVELDLKDLDSAKTYKLYRDTVLPLSGSKVQIGGDITGTTTTTATDTGPLPVDAYYQAEGQP